MMFTEDKQAISKPSRENESCGKCEWFRPASQGEGDCYLTPPVFTGDRDYVLRCWSRPLVHDMQVSCSHFKYHE